MNKDLKRKIPKIPHWRYLLVTDQGGESFEALKQYLEEERPNIGLHDFEDPLFDEALYFFETKPIRKVIQNMVLENCGNKVICDVLLYKFNIDCDRRVITLYKKFFFDNKTFNNFELASYLGKDMPQAPSVPGAMRSDYAAYKQGAVVEIDSDMALQQMFNRAFFRSQELSRYGSPMDDQVMKYQNQAVNIYKVMKDFNQKSSLPEEFQYEIEYPEDTAIDIEDLEDGQYSEE